MSSELVLFEAVTAGAIETLFDRENKPWFKRAGLRLLQSRENRRY